MSQTVSAETQEEYTLTIRGFKTKEQVLAFASWYEGQGQQDTFTWFECLQEEGKLDVTTMNVDIKKYTAELKQGFRGNNFDFWLKL